MKLKDIIKFCIYKSRYSNVSFLGVSEIAKDNVFDGKNVIGENCIIANCKIGYATYIGKNSELRNACIGKYCSISSNVKVLVGHHPTNYVSTHPCFYSLDKQAGFTYVTEQKYEETTNIQGYSCIIGNDVWIGDGVRIKEGISIGDGAVIAAGAIITKDVEPYAIVGGIPAKLIRKRFNQDTINKLMNIKWWNKDEQWIKEHSSLFTNVDKFIGEINE